MPRWLAGLGRRSERAVRKVKGRRPQSAAIVPSSDVVQPTTRANLKTSTRPPRRSFRLHRTTDPRRPLVRKGRHRGTPDLDDGTFIQYGAGGRRSLAGSCASVSSGASHSAGPEPARSCCVHLVTAPCGVEMEIKPGHGSTDYPVCVQPMSFSLWKDSGCRGPQVRATRRLHHGRLNLQSHCDLPQV